MFTHVRRLGGLIRFSHSIFALPFAVLIFFVLLEQRYVVTPLQITLLLVCIVAARTAAMAFNRIADLSFDASNPRTQSRELPSGRVGVAEAWLLLLVSASLFIAGSFFLGTHCLVMAIPVLVLLLGYSLLKRYTALCHFALGVALASAPGGVWYAVTGYFAWEPVPLMCGVLFWVSGFDILYALQDREFDEAHKLHSIPVVLGERGSKIAAALSHVASVVCLIGAGISLSLNLVYYFGVACFALNIGLQHRDVARGGLQVIDQSFFLRNGIASVLLCFFGLVDLWL